MAVNNISQYRVAMNIASKKISLERKANFEFWHFDTFIQFCWKHWFAIYEYGYSRSTIKLFIVFTNFFTLNPVYSHSQRYFWFNQKFINKKNYASDEYCVIAFICGILWMIFKNTIIDNQKLVLSTICWDEIEANFSIE